jgi:hypothetical protein
MRSTVKLANGATAKSGTQMTGYGFAPLYGMLGKKREIVSGELEFPAWPATGTMEGILDWNLALSSTTLALQHAMNITGSSLVAANPPFPLTGGGLMAPLTAVYDFDSKGRIVITGPNPQFIGVSLSIKTGVFTGKFTPPGATRAVSFGGVILQQQRSGGGFFLNGAGSGSVELSD